MATVKLWCIDLPELLFALAFCELAVEPLRTFSSRSSVSMSSEGGTEAEPLSAVATIEKGTVTGVGETAAGSSTPKFVQLVRENSGHFVTLSITL